MPDWLGDIPTWIACIAIVFAGFQFMIDRERRREELHRARREQARQLTSWTVSNPEQGQRAYGLVLSNTSGSTFHEVSVEATLHGSRTKPLTLTILPPGEFFIQHAPNQRYEWEFAVAVADWRSGELRPYMKSSKYRVDSVDFADNSGVRWHTDDHALLVERGSTDA